jgi:hypothetical protein
MGGITDNISCVPIRESKADTQPRNEVRSIVSAGPSCHRRHKASNISPGHVSRRRRASAKANSLTPRRQSVGRGLRRDGNMGALGRPARSLPPWCQTNLVLPVSSAVSVRCNVACEMEAVQKWPISRLLPIVLAGRSLAAYCGVLPVRSIAGYCGSWPDEVSRPTGAIGLRYCWFMSGGASRHPGVSWGAPDLRPVSSVCGRRNEAKALRRCLRIAAAEWSGLQSWRVRPGRGRNSADTCPEHFRGSVGSVKPKGKF